MFRLKRLHEGRNRNNYLDFLRGMAMLLVIYQHAGWSRYAMPAGSQILGFHMPFFFMLTGYLFALNKSLDRPGGGTVVVVLSGC